MDAKEQIIEDQNRSTCSTCWSGHKGPDTCCRGWSRPNIRPPENSSWTLSSAFVHQRKPWSLWSGRWPPEQPTKKKKLFPGKPWGRNIEERRLISWGARSSSCLRLRSLLWLWTVGRRSKPLDTNPSRTNDGYAFMFWSDLLGWESFVLLKIWTSLLSQLPFVLL